MTSPELLVAAMLLTIPPGNPCATPSAADWPGLRDAVVQVAIEREILDPREAREARTYFVRPEDFCGDVNMLRRRSRELEGAPMLADARRLPPDAVALELVKFNRAYHKHVEARCQHETDRAAALQVVLEENQHLYRVWDAVRDAKRDNWYVTNRRQSLRRLRDLVGEEAFRRGELPPAVPTWRFVAAE